MNQPFRTPSVLYISACVRQDSRTGRLAEALLKTLDLPKEEVRLDGIRFPVADEAFLRLRDRLISEEQWEHPLFDAARQFAAAETVVTARYVQFCRQLNEKEAFAGKNICIEVTEQAAIAFDEETIQALHALHDMGLILAIDDFSMGQTSIRYLRDGLFDIIKLDGSLVSGLITHGNTRDIILSITQLAKSLNMKIIAEFVDSEEKRELLHETGCDCYQGYLYSPAVFLQSK